MIDNVSLFRHRVNCRYFRYDFHFQFLLLFFIIKLNRTVFALLIFVKFYFTWLLKNNLYNMTPFSRLYKLSHSHLENVIELFDQAWLIISFIIFRSKKHTILWQFNRVTVLLLDIVSIVLRVDTCFYIVQSFNRSPDGVGIEWWRYNVWGDVSRHSYSTSLLVIQ